MMKELLAKINDTLNKSIANSNAETQLQIKILKNNINALFAEYEQKENGGGTPVVEAATPTPVETPAPQPVQQTVTPAPSAPTPQAVVQPATPVATPTSASIERLDVEEKPDVLDQDDMKSVLIVDDSSMIRNYLERIFINEYNITMAVDGNDAVEKIQAGQDKFNIILLDLVMPKADGFFVLEYLSKYSINIPVIIISGDTSKESINKAFEYGVVDMIKKPFDSDIIKEKIIRYSK